LPTPVAYWPFDEASGPTAADASGNGHTATLVHGTWDTSALKKFGPSALANTDGGHGASIATINLGTVHSIGFWLNGWDGSNDGSVITGPSGMDPLYITAASVYYAAGAGNFATLGATVMTGSHHYVVTRNGGVTITSYRDGVFLGTANLSTNTALTLDTINGSPGGNPLVATIDDLRLYDVALTGPQVAELYALTPVASPIRGSFVAGERTTVTATRAAAFGLDGNTNTHAESGTFKVFGKVAITGDLEVGGAIPAHAVTHEAGGVDPIQLDDLAAPSDNTDLNATTSAHGLLRKLSGLDVQVLRGDGTWGMSPLTSGVFAYTFSTTTTAPPGSQRIRFDAGHPYTAVTKLWADFSSSNSEDLYWGWMRIRVGSLLMVQDKDNHLQYVEFTTTGLPIDHGTYVELPVAWASNGTALAVQGVLVRVTAPAVPASAAAVYDAPLTNGDLVAAELIFAGGACVIVQVPV